MVQDGMSAIGKVSQSGRPSHDIRATRGGVRQGLGNQISDGGAESMAGSKGPRLGPALFRAMDGVSDYAAIIVLVDGWWVNVAVFDPATGLPAIYRKVKFDPDGGPQSAKPGTVYVW